MNYILVAEDEAEIRELYEIILKRSYPLDVVTVESGNKALEVIAKRGKPEIIFSDFHMPDGDAISLYRGLSEQGIKVPLVICSTDIITIKRHLPGLYGYIEKPDVMASILKFTDSVIARVEEAPLYIPVRISFFLRRGTADFDLYMKLNEQKFIKVINSGEAFLKSDAGRFTDKSIDHLFVTYKDAENLLQIIQSNLNVMNFSSSHTQDVTIYGLESLELVERIAFGLGWTPHVIESAKEAVNMAMKAVSLEPDLMKLIEKKLSNPTSQFSSHTTQLALLSCGFCYHLGWRSESTQLKLGIASLMHDLCIDETIYEDIHAWNESAADLKIKTPEVVKYRNHPVDAATMVSKMKSLPPDIDQIILQHHENHEGTGFPRGLTGSRISPMASILIIAEDLVDFIKDGGDVQEKVSSFLKYRGPRYSSGNFKKVFEAIKAGVKKSPQNT